MVIFKPYDYWLRPPHKVTRPEQVVELAESMRLVGWQGPPLIGYPVYGYYQLLSGTHRHAAARIIGVGIPVILRSYEEVRDAYGDLERWREIMTTA
jgi:ParB-like chromosome segregation protein Spo0J